MTPAKLKVGLLLDGFDVARWELTMFEEIVEGDFAEFVLVVVNEAARAKQKRTLRQKLSNDVRHVFAHVLTWSFDFLYRVLIDRRTRIPDALELVDCREVLKGIPVMRVTPRRTTYSDYFEPDDVRAIQEREIDILIRSGFGILRGDILKASRFGVWSFHHGDNRVNRGGPPGFWESMESWPATGSMLQILNEDLDNGLVLRRSASSTDPFSIRDSRSRYYWKSLSFMTRAMRELHARGEEEFLRRAAHANRHPVFYSRRLYRPPTVGELARLTLSKIAEKSKFLVRNRVYFDQWVLAFHLRKELSTSLWRYRKILPPRDRFWADPHAIARDGRYYIFIEEFLYDRGKGHVAVMAMEEDGRYEEPVKVLEQPYHLSYPFVFEHDADLFMVPETMENETIELYKCVEFPTRWELVMRLRENVRAVDTTLLRRDGKWWMFTNIVSHPGVSADDELFLFSSNDLLSRSWCPHPMNPIVSDCRRARSAGRIFEIDGRLYRPSQNCALTYGHGFNLGEIVELTETGYREEIVSRVEPIWDDLIVGTHTFTRAGRLHMVDALHRRRRYGPPRKVES